MVALGIGCLILAVLSRSAMEKSITSTEHTKFQRLSIIFMFIGIILVALETIFL